jgi:hypothetical protein
VVRPFQIVNVGDRPIIGEVIRTSQVRFDSGQIRIARREGL